MFSHSWLKADGLVLEEAQISVILAHAVANQIRIPMAGHGKSATRFEIDQYSHHLDRCVELNRATVHGSVVQRSFKQPGSPQFRLRVNADRCVIRTTIH